MKSRSRIMAPSHGVIVEPSVHLGRLLVPQFPRPQSRSGARCQLVDGGLLLPLHLQLRLLRGRTAEWMSLLLPDTGEEGAKRCL